MKWLITIKSRSDLEPVIKTLAKLEARSTGDAIPMDNGEQVVPADGPGDLPQRLRGVSGVLKISPASEMTYY